MRFREEEEPDRAGGTERILDCLKCDEKFSRNDVRLGRYRPRTMICSHCYAKMQKAPYSVSCFGKPTTVYEDHQYVLGFHEDAKECKRCLDRAECRSIVIGHDET